MATTKTPARRRSAAATDTAMTELPPAVDAAAAPPAKAAKTAKTAKAAKAGQAAKPAAAKKRRAAAPEVAPEAAPTPVAAPAPAPAPAPVTASVPAPAAGKPARAAAGKPAKPARRAPAEAAPSAPAAGTMAESSNQPTKPARSAKPAGKAKAAPVTEAAPVASRGAPAPAQAPAASDTASTSAAEPAPRKTARPRGRSANVQPEASPAAPVAERPADAAPAQPAAAGKTARKKAAGKTADNTAETAPAKASDTTSDKASDKTPDTAPKQASNKPARQKAASPKRAATATGADATATEPGGAVADTAEHTPVVANAASSAPAQAPAPEPASPPEPEPAPAATAAPAPSPQPAAPAVPPRPPARPGEPSRWQRTAGDRWRLQWHPGDAPAALHDTVAAALDAEGTLSPEAADALLPQSLRLAAEAGHRLEVDPAIWPLVAADRDHRTRAAWLAARYPEGPASPALAQLLTVPLAPFQAEGALWSVVAGRGLLADEPGLGKGVQAIAAARLWQRHFGLERVLVLCAPAQRLGWQQAWRRLAGEAAQVLPASPMQRGALWGAPAAVRILSPEALASDAAALAEWAPQLAIVDEPQRLGLDAAAWQALVAVPQLLVLCGAALDADPALLEQLVDRLDPQRLGPYAAWGRLRAARDAGQALDEDALEAVSDQLSRVLLQRQRAELAEQLPPVIHATRWTTLDDAQRAVHDTALAQAGRLVAGWQRSGYLADADQWQLSSCLVTMQQAALRADPARADSPLAEAVLQALAGQLDDWAEAGEAPVLLRYDRATDAEQLRARLGERPGLQLLAPGERAAGGAGRVLQLGAPWRLRREPLAGDGQPGQHWVTVAAADSLDQGLVDTLAQRGDAPRGPAEPGGRGFLAGERLQAWLQAVAAALAALQATRSGTAG